jgi:hypothetical protein
MRKLFKVLGFVFSWLTPFGVIYVNHVVLEEAQYNVDMFGLLIVLGLFIALVKYIDGRVEKWDIRNEHKAFRINWSNGKKLFLMIGLTWGLFTIEDSLGKLQLSAILMSISFGLGWLFTLIGNIKKGVSK